MKEENKTIWTIGHSTRSFEEFGAMLHSFSIELVADVRSYPGSRKFPQFNKDALEISLPQANIQYVHSEAVWWRCHRSLISDYLKVRGWKVMHIMSVGKAGEHPYTAPARIVKGELNYEPEGK